MRKAVLALCLCWPFAVAAETVEWERTPIALVLAVGVERQIRFEGPATVGVPADLVRSGALRAEFANDTAYWLATEPFAARRFRVRLERTGEFVLFDVRAVAGGGAPEPLEVTVARPEREGFGKSEANAEDPRSAVVELVRFVARRDLAPLRLAATPAGVVSVETAVADATGLYRHPDRERLRLAVLGAWSARGLFVTVLEASNRSAAPLDLDVRRLRPASVPRGGVAEGFVAVGWTRSRLARAGEPGSAARVYVATREPFAQAAGLP